MGRRRLLQERCRLLVIFLPVLLLVLGLTGLAPDVAAWAHPPVPEVPGCEPQQQALEAVLAEGDRHNAQPHVFEIPEQQAAANAYDAEAERLDAERAGDVANLKACARALDKLAAGGKQSKPPPGQGDRINAAKGKLPQGYAPPAPPPRNGLGGVAVDPPMRPLAKQLRRRSWPDDSVWQGKSRPALGDPDPALNGAPIPGQAGNPLRPDVAADHIVPLAQLMYMPGFLKLPGEYMYMVANSPRNMQWLSAYANLKKNSDSAARIIDAEPAWLNEQLALESSTRAELQDVINQLLTSLGIR